MDVFRSQLLVFKESDVRSPIELASRLCYATDQASEDTREVVDKEILTALEAALPRGNSVELSGLVVQALNSLLKSPQLFEQTRSDAVTSPVSELLSESGIDDWVQQNRSFLIVTFGDYLEPPENEPEDLAEVRSASVRSVVIGDAVNTTVVTGDNVSINAGTIDHRIAVSEFEVKEAESKELLASFVSPRGYEDVASQLDSRSLIWIVGPPEAGKKTLAHSLALLKRRFQSVYMIKGRRAWGIISESPIDHSVILLTDAVYLTAFAEEADTPGEIEPVDAFDMDEDEETPAEGEINTAEIEAIHEENTEGFEFEDQAPPLKQLLDRGNTLIITSTDEIFSRTIADANVRSTWGSEGFRFNLNKTSYGHEQRLRLVHKAINLAGEKEPNSEIKKWALQAYAKLGQQSEQANKHPIFSEWLPGEIVSFVTSILASATGPDEIEAELRIPLSQRVHSWFMELKDESTRFFVLTRVIFPYLDVTELQDKIEEIVTHLGNTYVLSLAAVSVYSFKATAYISNNRPYRFINDRVLRAVTEVVAECYSRPFRDLCPLLKKWTAPSELTSSTDYWRDKIIRETNQVRMAVARMAGIVGTYELSSVEELINHWAAHPSARIGQAAGVSLRQIASGNFAKVLNLVEEWAKDSAPETGHFRKRSAADALWRLVNVVQRPSERARALALLEYQSKDSNPYVRRSVSYAATQIAHGGHVSAARDLLDRLADDQREGVRTQLAVGLASAKVSNQQVDAMIVEWANSDNFKLCEIAVLYLLIRWQTNLDKTLVYQLARDRPLAFEKAMLIAVKLVLRRRKGPFGPTVLRRMLEDLAAHDDIKVNQHAIVGLCELKRGAVLQGSARAQSYANKILHSWEGSSLETLQLAACGCHFLLAQSPADKLNALRELYSIARSDQARSRIHIAETLTWMAARERSIVHQLLQEWLVSNDSNAVVTAIFYWFVSGRTEPKRYEYIISLLTNFPISFDGALADAVDNLPWKTLDELLAAMATDENAIVRRQVSNALGRMALRNEIHVYELLEDWLALGDINAAATVVLFWIAAGNYDEQSRYDNLTGIQTNFPLAFDLGMRDAVRLLGAECLTPQVAALRQMSISNLSV